MNRKGWLAAGVLALLVFACFPFWLMTEGTLPTHSEAISIRGQVLSILEEHPDIRHTALLPSDVRDLNPLSVSRVDGGVLLVFWERFVEARGYLFLPDTDVPSEGMQVFCSKIAECVYSYGNPG